MNKSAKTIALSLALLAGLTVQALPARAESADDVWKAAKAHVQSLKDYTLKYDYHGPKGEYKFDYRCVRPSDIRTQIVQGENAGAILVFKPSDKADKVKAKKGMFTVWKDVTDDKIKGTPIIESVYDMAIRESGGDKVALKGDEKVGGHDCFVLTFGNGAELAIDKGTKDILRWKQPEAGAVAERDFYDVQTNKGAAIGF